MGASVGREPAGRLLELPFTCDSSAGLTRVVPRDGHVHETLEEVALARIAGAPGVLERLVGREELRGLEERDPAAVRVGDRIAGHVQNPSDARFQAV